eukprot:361077-Chlamydomonas_euryale.AAC.1
MAPPLTRPHRHPLRDASRRAREPSAAAMIAHHLLFNQPLLGDADCLPPVDEGMAFQCHTAVACTHACSTSVRFPAVLLFPTLDHPLIAAGLRSNLVKLCG